MTKAKITIDLTETELLDILEHQITAHGLDYVLELISDICEAKAEGKTNGERSASDWYIAAQEIYNLPIMPLGGKPRLSHSE